jgi:hypothetical protein
VFGHGWLQISSPHGSSLMIVLNLGLEIVAIHPDSGENFGDPIFIIIPGRAKGSARSAAR